MLPLSRFPIFVLDDYFWQPIFWNHIKLKPKNCFEVAVWHHFPCLRGQSHTPCFTMVNFQLDDYLWQPSLSNHTKLIIFQGNLEELTWKWICDLIFSSLLGQSHILLCHSQFLIRWLILAPKLPKWHPIETENLKLYPQAGLPQVIYSIYSGNVFEILYILIWNRYMLIYYHTFFQWWYTIFSLYLFWVFISMVFNLLNFKFLKNFVQSSMFMFRYRSNTFHIHLCQFVCIFLKAGGILFCTVLYNLYSYLKLSQSTYTFLVWL